MFTVDVKQQCNNNKSLCEGINVNERALSNQLNVNGEHDRHSASVSGKIKSMMGLGPSQGNLRLVFRLFCLFARLAGHKTLII